MSIDALSTSSLDSLISQLMTLERQPLTTLKSKKSEISVTVAMYTDLKGKLSSLKSLVDELASSESTAVFNSKTVTSGDAKLISASADSSAADATYSIQVSTLAKAQRVQSDRQSSSAASIGYTGSIRVQDVVITIDETNNSLEGIRDAINGATYATGRGVTASVIDNRLVISSQATGEANRVALADLSGNVLSSLGIVSGSSVNLASGAMASASSFAAGYEATNVNDSLYGDGNAWQSSVAGSGYIELDLGSVQTVSRVNWSRDGSGAANDRVPQDYSIQVSSDGVNWTTVKTVTGHNFANAGESADDVFASVSARYVRLDVTATSDGLEPAIDELRVYNDTDMYGANQLQDGTDASFSIDGVQVKRSSNTELTDVVTGLTINLNGESTSAVSLKVAANTEVMTGKIKSLLSALNDVTSYLRTKSAVTKIDDNTYNRGQLAGNYTYTTLRTNLYGALASDVSGATGIFKNLSQIGITMDANMMFTVSDSAALSNALSAHTADVAQLFNLASDGLTTKLAAVLEPYSAASGVVDSDIAGLDDESKSIDAQIRRMEEQLTAREAALRSQYAAMQEAVNALLYQQSVLLSLSSYNTGGFAF
jgi:flagellar capping protein FliD